jgi:hypothetical protein
MPVVPGKTLLTQPDRLRASATVTLVQHGRPRSGSALRTSRRTNAWATSAEAGRCRTCSSRPSLTLTDGGNCRANRSPDPPWPSGSPKCYELGPILAGLATPRTISGEGVRALGWKAAVPWMAFEHHSDQTPSAFGCRSPLDSPLAFCDSASRIGRSIRSCLGPGTSPWICNVSFWTSESSRQGNDDAWLEGGPRGVLPSGPRLHHPPTRAG